jgi:hypothetical protein
MIEKDGALLMIKFNRSQQCIELFPDLKLKNFELQKELVDFILEYTEDKKE